MLAFELEKKCNELKLFCMDEISRPQNVIHLSNHIHVEREKKTHEKVRYFLCVI